MLRLIPSPAVLLSGALLLSWAFLSTASAGEKPMPGKQVEQSFTTPGDDSQKLDYLLFLPQNYEASGKKLPLILFLHGAGERGSGNLELVKKHGPPKLVEKNAKFPFVVVSPQCPKNERWSQQPVNELLTSILKNYNVDPQRVYLTGLSMGGFGTWDLAARHPERFAAIVPICGGGDPQTAEQLKSMPTWVFHGAKDGAVPLKRSQEMVDAVKAAGNKHIEFTIYPDAGHDSWTESYANPDLYVWLLKHVTGEE